MYYLSTFCAVVGNCHMMRGRPVSSVVAHSWGTYWHDVWGL